VTVEKRKGKGNLLGDHCCTKAEGETGGQDKPVPPCEGGGRDNPDTAHCNRGEQEGRHTTEHCTRNRHQRRRKLRKNSHNDKPEASKISSLAVSTSCKSNNTVVLCESGHGCNSAQRSNDAVQTVCEHATLDTRVEELAVDFKTRDIAGGGDVANGFHSEHHVDC
jgi:hypothetical protein